MRTEKEKMPAGEVYNPGDEELLHRWHLSKKLMKSFRVSCLFAKL